MLLASDTVIIVDRDKHIENIEQLKSVFRISNNGQLRQMYWKVRATGKLIVGYQHGITTSITKSLPMSWQL
jgi:hypothetical protein